MKLTQEDWYEIGKSSTKQKTINKCSCYKKLKYTQKRGELIKNKPIYLVKFLQVKIYVNLIQ